MTTGLGLDAFTSVDQDHRQVAVGGTGGHVAGVLLVPWAVGNDEFAFVGAEITVGNVDGDTLFTLGLQTIHQQGQVEFAVGGVEFLGVFFNGGQLVFKNQLGVVQHAADQSGLAVIDVATSQETQNVLFFVLLEVGQNVFFNQIRGMCHSISLNPLCGLAARIGFKSSRGCQATRLNSVVMRVGPVARSLAASILRLPDLPWQDFYDSSGCSYKHRLILQAFASMARSYRVRRLCRIGGKPPPTGSDVWQARSCS